MREMDCPKCGGGRLKQESLHYRIGDQSIGDLARMDLTQLRDFVADVPFDTERQARIGGPIVKEVRERLNFLIGVGVGYLTLDRPARTFSGGESQRIRLATQVGTQLTGVLYVLDEPTIGLHPHDNDRLIRSLESLRDLGNSVIVVEHDRDMIEAADHVVDLGPGAGTHGGHVITTGPPSVLTVDPVEQTNGEVTDDTTEYEIEDNGVAREQVAERAAAYDSDHYDFRSLTAAYLQGERVIPLPEEQREGAGESLVLEGATGHNLKGQPVEIPLGTFICVTGVSGSGKSTLVNQTLFPILHRHHHNAKTVPLPYDDIEGIDNIDKVIEIDQQPIGRTPRSNAATYTKLMDSLRNLFAKLPEAEIRGYTKTRFSFNTDPGRCDKCGGTGKVTLEMNFLPDVDVTCDECDGKRYGPETLEVEYKGKNIAEVLEMTVAEALDFFENQPRLLRTLKTLDAVGLGYLTLGQPSTTLSGGEAQRVKLSKELSRPGTGDTLYILDEPTTGMHFEDIRHLLNVLHGLVDAGNTVIVIEHNMDIIKQADHVIDLGPEGGRKGGEILFEGTPEALADADTHTSDYLREELERTRAAEDGEHAAEPVGGEGEQIPA
jgi:excinuclease ABC subunit A